MTDHVLVIYNPSLKTQVKSQDWMGQLVAELNRYGQYLISFYPTAPETQARDLVPLLVPPLKLVIAAGGDGTIRMALAALAMARSPIPAALFPLGTGNVLARNLGIVDNELLANPLEHAYDYIAHGVPMRIDMGMMNGEYFAGMAGVGPLSDAFMLPKREEKSRAKLIPYIRALLDTIAMPPRIFRVKSAGRTYRFQGSGIFISNVEDLGIGAGSNLSSLSDGLLDLHVINPAKVEDYLCLIRRYAGGCRDENPADYVFRVKEAVIDIVPRQGKLSPFQKFVNGVKSLITGTAYRRPGREGELPCMIDGDLSGATPLRVTVIPSAVIVLVPPQRMPGMHLSVVDDNQDLPLLPAAAGQ